jgi:hypothetical protein
MTTPSIEEQLAEARAQLAAKEEEIQQLQFRGTWLDDLPRVDLGEVLRAFDPVSVGTEMGHEYIVVAPRGTMLADPGQISNQISMQHIRNHGLPIEQGKARIGIGAKSGQVTIQPRVDYTGQSGVTTTDDDMQQELGTAVASPWTAWTRMEYNADLFGYKGLQVYDKMWKSDGTVRGTLRLAMSPVLAAQWGIKPASDNVRDINIANFVWANLTQWMSTSFPQFTAEALLMLKYGYYMFEKVFAHGEDVTNDPKARGKIVWKKLAPRHPMDVKEWYFDVNGGPLSVDMWAPPVSITDQVITRLGQGAASPIPSQTFQGGVIQDWQRWINIPIDKLIVFSYDKEAGNIEGVSLLRSAYKHWYYKDNLYKIDAIQKERHGIGIPIVQLPMGYSPDDKRLADQLGRNLRTNDRAHVVLPPNWILEFAELKGHPVDCIPSIKHHDDMIPMSIIGQFMLTQKTDIEEQHTIFLKATRNTADIFLDVMNSFAIPQLVQMNWGRSVYPRLYAKRIGEQEDWRTQSFTIRNYVGAGVIVPDDALENQIRDEMGLPPVDEATARYVKEPQAMNPQRIQPAPTEEPGPGHQIVPAQMPGIPPTPYTSPNFVKGQQAAGQAGSSRSRSAGTPFSQASAPIPKSALPKPNAPKPPRVGPPRQAKPGVQGRQLPLGGQDRSGKSKRRGQ